MTTALTPQETNQTLALAGVVWALLDAESRGIGSAANAALVVFQTSWSAWSGGARRLFMPESAVPRSLAPGWSDDTEFAMRLTLGVVLQHLGVDTDTAADIADEMPGGMAPNGARGTWFVTRLASLFPESSGRASVLWDCARILRPRGDGAALSAHAFAIATTGGVASIAPGASDAVTASNAFVRSLVAGASPTDLDTMPADGFRITGRAPAAPSDVPWGLIIAGGSVVLLGGIATAVLVYRKRRGLGGQIPNPWNLAAEQLRWPGAIGE